MMLPAKDRAASRARLRLRPILMTSFAFIMGVVPLVVSADAIEISNQVRATMARIA